MPKVWVLEYFSDTDEAYRFHSVWSSKEKLIPFINKYASDIWDYEEVIIDEFALDKS